MRTHSLMARAEFGEDGFVDIGGHWIHYVEAGQGLPVVFIPGFFCTYRTWNTILPILAREYRILAVDYLGVGDSDKPRSGYRYSIPEQADSIASLIRELRLGKPYLVGASYGSSIAFRLAAHQPQLVGKIVSIEGGIVRVEPGPYGLLDRWLAYPILGDAAIALIRTGWFNRTALRVVFGEWFPQMTDVERRRVLSELKFGARSATRAAWHGIGNAHRTSAPFGEEAKRIAAPILYLAGRQSDFRGTTAETIRFLETHLPQAEILEYEDGIHDLQSQKPYEVARRIREFLG
jgi:pimeloyl-ACP methyl ester carboxylesterase